MYYYYLVGNFNVPTRFKTKQDGLKETTEGYYNYYWKL